MKNYLLVAGSMLLLAACKNGSGEKKFEVKGTITNNPAKVIYLEEVPMATMQRIVVDSATIGKEGKYNLKTETREATVYNLRLDQNAYPLASVINDADRIIVDAVFSKENKEFADKYEIKGSEASNAMKETMLGFNTRMQELFAIDKTGDSLQKNNGGDSLLIALSAERMQKAEAARSFVLEAIKKSSNPAMSMIILGYYQSMANNPAFNIQPVANEEVTEIVNGLSAKFPDHTGVASIKRMLEGQTDAGPQWVGKPAPEISLPDVNGKEVKLSSYKGKYVLVDFWASWCKPCRLENPNVVQAYNKFKDKNFTILGVSLDERKESWLKAIEQDQLSWTHISDLKQWESAVVPVYNFGQTGIPFNVLVDPSGKIIAQGLRGSQLEQKLAEVLQ